MLVGLSSCPSSAHAKDLARTLEPCLEKQSHSSKRLRLSQACVRIPAQTGQCLSHAAYQQQRPAVCSLATASVDADLADPDTCIPEASFGFRTDFEDAYELQEQIGRGAWSTVFKAVERADGHEWAVKIMKKVHLEDGCSLAPAFQQRTGREISVHKALRKCLNVARLHDVFEDRDNVYLVTELCRGGLLWQRVSAEAYGEQDAAKLIQQVLQIVAQCHKKHIIIRDVKPENLLFLNDDKDAPLKAIDFGIAQACEPGQVLEERCGSPVYVAPEILKKSYGLPADVWSAGMIAYMLLTARLPWVDGDDVSVSHLYDGDTNGAAPFTRRDAFKALMFSDLDFTSPPWDIISDDARDLVSSLLQKDPEKRITAKAALKHRWFETAVSSQPFEGSLVQRLQQYGQYGRMKQASLRKLVAEIAHEDEEVQHLVQAHEELSKKSRGHSPSYKEVLGTLHDFGFDLTEREGLQLIEQLDLDKSGSIDLHEWLAALMNWSKIRKRPEWNRWVGAAFRSMDEDESGDVCVSEMSRLLEIDISLSGPGELEAAMQECDANQDGRLCINDFRELLSLSDSEEDLLLFSDRKK